jgi:CubicO group peptidase (beta-lactamase class C family)
MSDRRRFLLATLLTLGLTAAPALARPPQASALAGTWDGTYEPPGVVGGDPLSLLVSSVEGERVHGTLVLPSGPLEFDGSLSGSTLRFEVPMEDTKVALELTLGDGKLTGLGRAESFEWGFRLEHADGAVLARSHAPRVVELASRERPATFTLDGLDTEDAFALDELMRSVAEKNGVVGLSVACVVAGELVDVRSLGWEDFFADVPASGETRYRWASISKPLTATMALHLAARGVFDLDADVRTLVPDFPEKQVDGKKVRITPRLIMVHQSGITHYAGATRTWRKYDAPHPFDELVNGLDLFRSAPLKFAPGTGSDYSTHAWTLLGVVLERAGKKPYAQLVKEIVLDPFGMTTTVPDRVASPIPHRTHGYERGAAGELVETFDDDVAWKLPGGGWTSTVGDLARFGAGLIGSKVLSDEDKRLAWSDQKLPDGTATGMGLGFFLGTLEGQRVIEHSGGQRKASTFLAVLPERRLAVAAMCNTTTGPMQEVAYGALRLLLKAPKR